MPCAANGARDDRQRACGHEECRGEDGGESGVLHAHLDGDGAVLSLREVEESADSIACKITEGVVGKYHYEDGEEEGDALLQQLVVHRSNHSAYDACEAEYGECRRRGCRRSLW